MTPLNTFIFAVLAGFIASWFVRLAARVFFAARQRPDDAGDWIIIADIEPQMAMRLAGAVREATGATRVRITRYRDYGWRFSMEHELPGPAGLAQPEGSVQR